MLKLTEPKKVLCIHDLSGVGRCSLAVILPVLSVMAVQPVGAAHRGALDPYGRVWPPRPGWTAVITAWAALEHYRELGLEFDCIYTGYLGGEAQAADLRKKPLTCGLRPRKWWTR